MDPKTIRPAQLAIQERFFQAFDDLKSRSKIKSLQSFCDEYGLHRPKYSRIRSKAEGSYKVIDIDALSYLVKDYGVSADWLLTGRGKAFKQPLGSD